MLRTIKIQNFQSHADSTITFDPGVNVIVGGSDAGKTAVLRSLNWLLWNRPRGSAFVRHGGNGECSVTLQTDTNEIIRRRGKSDNCYTLDGEVLEAVGSDVPAAVQQAMGLDEINIQGQLNPHYLVLDPPGQIAETFNSAIHLDRPEAARDAISAGIRACNQAAVAAGDRAQGAERSLRRFLKLDVYRATLTSGIAVQARLEASMAILTAVGELVIQLEKAGLRMKALRIPAGLGKAITKGERLLAERDGIAVRARPLRALLDNFKTVEKCERRLPDVPTARITEIVEEVTTERKRADALGREIAGLDKLLSSIDETEEILFDLVDAKERAAERYNETLRKLEFCPLCGQRVNAFERSKILENIK